MKSTLLTLLGVLLVVAGVAGLLLTGLDPKASVPCLALGLTGGALLVRFGRASGAQLREGPTGERARQRPADEPEHKPDSDRKRL